MEAEEFDAFYAGSLRRITGQVYAMIGDRDEAQECVQEAFARAWASRASIERAGNPDAWVRTTAYRLAVSRWRRMRRGRRTPDRAVSSPLTAGGVDGPHLELVEALRRLPEDQRRTIVLHYIADLPVREVALELGVPEGTVKARLHRGRASLANLLVDDADQAGGVSHA